MKKIVIPVILALCVGFTQMNAQQNVSFGIKADANLSNYILSHMRGVKSQMQPGADLGLFMKYDVTENFAIQPEMLFYYKKSKFKEANLKSRLNDWGMEVPVYAVGQWETDDSGRFYIGIGPYVGFGFNAYYPKEDANLYKNRFLHRWDFGGGVMAGYEFASGVQINAGYKFGFVNAFDKGKVGNAAMHPQVVTLGLGFRF